MIASTLARNTALACLAVLALQPSSEAGVRGNSYSGSFTNNLDQTFTSCMEYDTVGAGGRIDQSFSGGTPQGFDLIYSEFDLLLLSFWTAEGGQAEIQGVSFFFGLFTTFSGVGADVTFDGFYVRSNCTPAVTAGAVQATAKLGVVGGHAPARTDLAGKRGRFTIVCSRDC